MKFWNSSLLCKKLLMSRSLLTLSFDFFISRLYLSAFSFRWQKPIKYKLMNPLRWSYLFGNVD